MKYLLRLLITLGLGLAVITVSASPSAPRSGIEYVALEVAQPTETGSKVEVIEFFGYFCSVCNSFDPSLKEWSRKQGADIVFKRAAVGFGAASVPQQKLFYTLSAMGKLEELHSKIFNAIHVQRVPMRRDDQVFDFIEKNGVDRTQFIEIYNSFGIDSLTRAAVQLQNIFQVTGVPMIAIDGRYLTSLAMVAKGLEGNPSEAQLQAATLQVMDVLVAKAKRERNSVKSVVRK